MAALAVVTPRAAHAEALLVVEADTGKVLQADNATMPWYPASVTKIMTAYVTLKAVKEGRLSLDTVLTVSPVAASQSPSKMGFRPGIQVTVDNALKMMMVKSANDMAVVLAEGVGGSIDGFSAMMNQTAQKLGMTQTSYVNPNGLPADGQITSARDLAILARAVIRDLPEYEYFMHIPSIRYGRRITQNFNKLIGRYPGADGFKTGFICASGYNLVASATRNGKRLIAVVLGASSGQARAVRAAQLLERGFGGNGLGWLKPALGTVDNLVPIDASPPNLREEMCSGKRKRPASDEDAGHRRRQRQRVERRRNRRHVLHRRAAAADGEAVGAAGWPRPAVRADPGLYRPDQDRHGADRGRCGGRREADAATARQEIAGRGEEARRRSSAEGRSQCKAAAKPAGRQACERQTGSRRQAGRLGRKEAGRQARRRRQARRAKPAKPKAAAKAQGRNQAGWLTGREAAQLGSFPAVRPLFQIAECVDSAQPLAIGGGIHNTAQNKASRPKKRETNQRGNTMERIWLKQYPAGVPADIDVTQYSSLVELLEESFAKFADRKAFICMDKSISYRDLDEMSAALGAYLQSKGLQKGARVALMMPNVLQYPVATAAVLRAGYAVVNVNPLYTPRELEHQLKDSGAEAIIVLENFATTVQQVIAQDRGQACHRRQHGRPARLQGRDRQSGGPQGEEDGAGLVDPGRGLVQRCARRRPRHEAQQAEARRSMTSPSCNIPAAPPASPRARRCSTATSSPTCCRTTPGCSRR